MSNNFLIYKTEDEKVEINVAFDTENETVWLSQNQMAELFSTTKQNISGHIADIYEEGELDKGSTVKDFLTVQKEGNRDVSRQIKCYNLDVIISVGYRIKSIRGMSTSEKASPWMTNVSRNSEAVHISMN